MLVSNDQKAVFMLAQVVLHKHNLSVQTLRSGADIHYKNGGRPTILDWALAYIKCFPNNDNDMELLHNLHVYPSYRWNAEQAKRVAVIYRAFYDNLNNSRLYAKGVNLLNSEGRTLLQEYATNNN